MTNHQSNSQTSTSLFGRLRTGISFLPNFLFACLFLVHLIDCQQQQLHASPYHRRFEYKHSFRVPKIAHKDGTITFWEISGNAIAGDDQLRLAPSLRSQKGAVWNHKPMESEFWEVEMSFSIKGQSRIGADGLAFWYTAEKGQLGDVLHVFGSNNNWKGLGIFMDSFDNDNRRDNPLIGMMINNGSIVYTPQADGFGQLLAQCQKDYRNRPYPVKIKIEYVNKVISVSLTNGLTQNDPFELCIRVEEIYLPIKGYFGLSAATGGLADDHDVMSFEVWSLTSGQPEAPAQVRRDVEEKYNQEYQQYQQQFKEEKEKYQKEHPDKVKLSPDEQYAKEYEDPLQREIRFIREGQTHIFNVIQQLDAKMNQIVQQQQQISGVVSQGQQTAGGTAAPVPAGAPVIDTFQRHEVNEVLYASREMNANIKEIKTFVADLQSRIMVVDQRLTSGGVPTGGVPSYDVEYQKSHLEAIKREVEQIRLAQRTQNITCPTMESNCLSPILFIFAIVAQSIIFVLYSLFKRRNEKAKFY